MKHAIVLGGGFSGTLATCLLSQYFAKVTLIDSDDLVANLNRKGLPQAHHLHVLMQEGQFLLEQLMPGILTELNKENLTSIDWANDTKWVGPFGCYPNYYSNVTTLCFSRKLLDDVMLARIFKLKNVEIISGKCTNLIKDNDCIIGAIIDDRMVTGDLIVNACGRRATTADFLQQLDYPVLKPHIIKNNLGYASRIYKMTSRPTQPYKQIYLQVRPNYITKGAVVSPIENNKLMVTALGLGQDKPQKDEGAFQQHLLSLANVDFQNYLASLTPDGPVNIYRNLHNIHSRFGSMKKWPQNFIVIGDAACVLNPTYGQGMTLATKQVILLKKMLDKKQLPRNNRFGINFQKQVDRLFLLPWLLATAEDLREAPRETLPTKLRLLHRYCDNLLQLAVHDKKTHKTFIQVVHMIQSPYQLFHPKLMIKILLNIFSGKY